MKNQLGKNYIEIADRLKRESPSEFERTAWRLVKMLSIAGSELKGISNGNVDLSTGTDKVKEVKMKESNELNPAMAVGGVFVFLLFSIYNLTPLIGALSVIFGIIGFVIDNPHALRVLLFGICFLLFKPIVGIIFIHFLTRKK